MTWKLTAVARLFGNAAVKIRAPRRGLNPFR
jgi:hypothetical protein